MKILIHTTRLLGELIISIPMINALRQKYPGCLIHGCSEFDLSHFAYSVGLLDMGFDPRIQYDLDIPAVKPVPPIAVSEQWAKAAVPDFQGPFNPTLSITKSESTTGYIAIHPSGGFGRAWELWKWVKLSKALEERGEKLLIILGPKDFDLGQRVALTLPKDSFIACFNRTLLVTAQLLAGCKFFIGQEDGITHLAAALGIPGITTWNPEYAHWHPVGGNLKYISLSDDHEKALELCPKS